MREMGAMALLKNPDGAKFNSIEWNWWDAKTALKT